MSKKEIDPDFELNIASIIDCFTVLITYLLVSASFITLGMFDVTVASHSPSDVVDSVPPPLTVTIGILKNFEIKVSTEGSENNSYKIPQKEGGMDLESLTANLQKLKERFPKLEAAMITAEDTVDYKELVKTVEATRATFPQVALSADPESPL